MLIFAKKEKYEIYFHSGCSEKDNPLLFENGFMIFLKLKFTLPTAKILNL